MLSLKKSLNILKKTNALLEGHFVLSSGLHSSKYIQCAKLLSFPNKAAKICKSLASKIKKKFNIFFWEFKPEPNKNNPRAKKKNKKKLAIRMTNFLDSIQKDCCK